MEMSEFEEFYRRICQFDQSFGLELHVVEPGLIEYRLTVRKDHLSMPGSMHGGALSAMMDSVLGVTALSKVIPTGKLCQTVEFKINFFSTPSLDDRLLGTGKVEFLGRRTVVTSAQIKNETNQTAIAMGTGTFSTYPIEKRADEIAMASKWLASDEPA